MESEFDEADKKYIAHTNEIYLTTLLKWSYDKNYTLGTLIRIRLSKSILASNL